MNFNSVLSFGKYKGTSISYIMKIDPKYLAWVIRNTGQLDSLSKEDKKKVLKRAERKYFIVYGGAYSRND
jgi:hypothetical protein